MQDLLIDDDQVSSCNYRYMLKLTHRSPFTPYLSWDTCQENEFPIAVCLLDHWSTIEDSCYRLDCCRCWSSPICVSDPLIIPAWICHHNWVVSLRWHTKASSGENPACHSQHEPRSAHHQVLVKFICSFLTASQFVDGKFLLSLWHQHNACHCVLPAP